MKNNNYPSWLVPLEIAKELKEIGFDTPCSFYYDEKLLKISPWHDEEFVVTNWNDKLFRYCVSLPTHEQVFEWFREKGLYSFLRVNIPDLSVSYFIYDKDGYIEENGHRSAYEDAKNDCVKELIKIYKEHERNE